MSDLDRWLPAHVARALAAGGLPNAPVVVPGAAVVLDVRGFTALSEAAARRDARAGGELVASALDAFFAPLVELAGAYEASVSHFAGDALLAVLDERPAGGAAERAVGLAEAMLAAVEAHDGVLLARRRLRLTARAGAAAGGWWWAARPDGAGREVVVTAGPAVRGAIAAQRRAATGTLARDPSVAATTAAERGSSRLPPVPRERARSLLAAVVADRLDVAGPLLLAEHREVTVVVADIAGDDPGRLLDAVAALASRVAAAGATLLPVDPTETGVRLIALVGAPVAHEDAADRGLRLALAARDAGAWVGVATGRVYCGPVGSERRADYSAIGDAVNVAARLAAASLPGAPLVAAATASAAATGSFRDARLLTLAGRRAGTRAHVLVATAIAAEPAPAAAIAGRTRELARLGTSLAEARGGAGGCVVVTGPGGIGKSTLAGAVAARAGRAGFLLATARATSGEAAADALAPVVRALVGVGETASPARVGAALRATLAGIDVALAPLAPTLSTAAGAALPETPASAALSPERRLRVARDLVGALVTAAAAREPLCLVVEDAHHLGSAAADLLGGIATAAGACRALLLVTARAVTDALATSLVSDAVQIEPLAPLGTQAGVHAARLALGADVPVRVAREVARRAGGNPFVIGELVRLLHDRRVDLATGELPADLPDSVERLVLARVDRVSAGAQAALRVGCVVGPWFDAGALAQIHPALGGRATVAVALADAADAELLARVDGGFAFTHDLIRETLYAALADRIRRTLHAAAAARLEAGADADRDAEQIARHYAGTELHAAQRRWFARAAELARARFDSGREIEHLTALVPLLRARPRRRTLAELARAERVVGAWERAAGHLREAHVGAATTAERGIYARELGDLLTYQGHWDEGLELLRAAVADVAGDVVEEADALGTMAFAAFRRSAFAEAEAAATRQLALARGLSDASREGRALHLLAQVASVSDPAGAVRLERTALRVLRRAGDTEYVAHAANVLAGLEHAAGNADAAAASLAVAARTARRLGDRGLVAVLAGNAADLCLAAGDRERARDLVGYQLELSAEIGDATAHHLAHARAGYLAALDGSLAEARRLLEAAVAQAEACADVYFLPDHQLDLAAVAARAGDAAAARAAALAARRTAAAGEYPAGAAAATAALAALAAGRVPEFAPRSDAAPSPARLVALGRAFAIPGKSRAPRLAAHR